MMTLAGDLGIPVREELISRERLYLADEASFTGTAVEITPIVERDPDERGEEEPDYLKAARGALRNGAGGDPRPPRPAYPSKDGDLTMPGIA